MAARGSCLAMKSVCCHWNVTVNYHLTAGTGTTTQAKEQEIWNNNRNPAVPEIFSGTAEQKIQGFMFQLFLSDMGLDTKVWQCDSWELVFLLLLIAFISGLDIKFEC